MTRMTRCARRSARKSFHVRVECPIVSTRGISVLTFLTTKVRQLLNTFLLGRFVSAAGASARTIDVRRLFHSLALGAALLARRCHTRTNGMCTLLGFRSRHFFSPTLRINSRVIQDGILDTGKKRFRPKRNTFQLWSKSRCRPNPLYLSVLNRLRGSHLGCQAVLFNHGQMQIGEA